MPNNDHYIKLLKENFPNISFSNLENLEEGYCAELYDILTKTNARLKNYAFNILQEIIVFLFSGEMKNACAAYNDEEKILKINSLYYVIADNKESEEKRKKYIKICHCMFKVAVTHELWHYFIREFNLKYVEEWKEIPIFYEDHEDTIIEFFEFIKPRVTKNNNEKEMERKYAYPLDQIHEEFIVEAIAWLELEIIVSKKLKNEEYKKVFDFAEGIYNSYKNHLKNYLKRR